MALLTFPKVDALHTANGYSHVVCSGGTIHVAGQVAVDLDGCTTGVGDFAVQVRAAFANVVTALGAAGADAHAIAAMTIYCDASVERSDLRHLREMWGSSGPPSPPPAITLVLVGGLMNPDWLIEIQVTAVAGLLPGRRSG